MQDNKTEISNLQKMLIMKLELTLESIDRTLRSCRDQFSKFEENEPRKFRMFKKCFSNYFKWKKLYSNISAPFHWFQIQSWLERTITIWYHRWTKYTFKKKSITDVWIFRIFVYSIERFLIDSLQEYLSENKKMVVYEKHELKWSTHIAWIEIKNKYFMNNQRLTSELLEEYKWSVESIKEYINRVSEYNSYKTQIVNDYKILITYLRLLPKYFPDKNYTRNIKDQILHFLSYLKYSLKIE